jgi:hypothetical protein
MGVFNPKAKRDNSGGSTDALPEGKYKGIITATAPSKGENKGKGGRIFAWTAQDITFNFPDEKTEKRLRVFEDSATMKSLLEALGYDVDDEAGLNYNEAEWIGQQVVVYLTVSADGKWNRAKEFKAVPKRTSNK